MNTLVTGDTAETILVDLWCDISSFAKIPFNRQDLFLFPLSDTSVRDFDANLYLCEEAFGLLPLDTLERLAGTLLLYPYVLTLLLLGGMMAAAALRNMKR